MKYIEIKPSQALAEYVKCYWYLEKDYAVGVDSVEMIWPDGCIDVVIQIGARLQQNDDALPTSFVIGPLKQPVILRSEGLMRVIGVRFFAYGAYPFFHVPIYELADELTEFGAILGGKVDTLAAQIAELPLVDAIRQIEGFLLARMVDRTSDVKLIGAATALIYRQRGAVDMNTLAQQVNVSQRSLERKFALVVGQTAKTLARIVRFDQIKKDIIFNPTISLTELAHRYLYFDQAHFIHDFQQFTGQTPSAFALKVIEHQIYFYK